MQGQDPALRRRDKARAPGSPSPGFGEFLQTENAGSIVLLAATVLALILANTALYYPLERVWNMEIGVYIGGWGFSQSLLHWIDDGLMTVFFFVIGLEAKREIVVGELSKPRQALLPVLAALGGMIVPAVIFLAFNAGGAGERGWGIPMATDIAFALGVLTVLGSRIPSGLKVFLTALAIADDIGAIVVIALFYSSGVSWAWLSVAAALLAVLVMMNRRHVDATAAYAAIGVLVWLAVFNSGVHATIAGVLVALTIPTRSKLDPLEFTDMAREKLSCIEDAHVPGAHVLEDDAQQLCAFEIRHASDYVASPLQRMEHALLPISTFFILPLFALANAGVRLVGLDIGGLLGSPLVLGIVFGLLVGKPVGITAASWISVRLRLCELPSGVGWLHVIGAGILGGIGFTMSLFIAGLAFRSTLLLDGAKIGVLTTSAIAGALGYAFLRFVTRATRQSGAEPGGA